MGLTIWDSDGRVILGPNTFTVRLVDRFMLTQGTTVYRRSKVKAGMFCAFQCLTPNAQWASPMGIVSDGVVTIDALLRGTGMHSYDVECMVLANV